MVMVMSMLTATPQMTGSRDQAGRVALTRDEVMTASRSPSFCTFRCRPSITSRAAASCRRVGLGGRGGSCVRGSSGCLEE